MSVGISAATLSISYAFVLGVLATLSMQLLALPPSYLAWESYRSDRLEADKATLRSIADELAEEVRERWEAEAVLRRLNDPQPLPVSWEPAAADLTEDWEYLRETAADYPGGPPSDPAGWADRPADLSGSDHEIVRVFEQIPTGRLVVVGEPGAGKTMLLLRLTLELLHPNRRTPGEPVPVLVSLASWNPLRGEFRDWLAGQLVFHYPMLGKAAPGELRELTRAEALLNRRHLILVLDGLDELPAVNRSQALTAINEALRPAERIVLSSRTMEFELVAGHHLRPATAGEPVKLRSAAAIELRPLEPAAVGRYLRRDAARPASAARWDSVLDRLGTTEPVSEALSTPLAVSLARSVYSPLDGDRDPAELCDTERFPTATSINEHLFDAFIPSVYRTRARHDDCAWTSERAEKAFLFLAGHTYAGISAARPLAELRQYLLPVAWRRIVGTIAAAGLLSLLFLAARAYGGNPPAWCWYTFGAWLVYRFATCFARPLLHRPASALAFAIGQWKLVGPICAGGAAFLLPHLQPWWIAGWSAGWLASVVVAYQGDSDSTHVEYEVLAGAGVAGAIVAADEYSDILAGPSLIGLAAWLVYRLIAATTLYSSPMLRLRPPYHRPTYPDRFRRHNLQSPSEAAAEDFYRRHCRLYQVADWLYEPFPVALALAVAVILERPPDWAALSAWQWAAVGLAALAGQLKRLRKALALVADQASQLHPRNWRRPAWRRDRAWRRGQAWPRLRVRPVRDASSVGPLLVPIPFALALAVAVILEQDPDWAALSAWQWAAVGLAALTAATVLTRTLKRAIREIYPLLLATSFLPVRIYLALTGHLPWRLRHFLAHAHHVHGVLRRSGAMYQFRHLELHRRLAGRCRNGYRGGVWY
ncbi:NACHT domain-containing protein [Streptomyces sp. NPDC029004]|uniref:NACHT domain-containing protein n=1 Tax=Streptomyces sp. NPDC029004 TaxID=3154490 RepID=UPI0033E4396B